MCTSSTYFCILVNRTASNCKNRVKYVNDATVVEIISRLSPSYLNFAVLEIYLFAFSRGMVLNSKKCKEMCISFLQYCPFPPAPLLEKVSRYKLLGVHLSHNLTCNEHVTHTLKKGNSLLYVIRALKKCGLADRQLILVYHGIIRFVLEYTSPALSYENTLKKSGLIFLHQIREDAYITFLKQSYSSSGLLRRLVTACCTNKTVCP